MTPSYDSGLGLRAMVGNQGNERPGMHDACDRGAQVPMLSSSCTPGREEGTASTTRTN